MNRIYKLKKIIILIIVVLLSSYLLIKAYQALLPFLFAIILAYLFNPIIGYLKKRGFPRQGAVILLMIGVFNVIFISSLYLLPAFLKELSSLAEILPGYIKLIEDNLQGLYQKLQLINLPGISDGLLTKILTQFENIMNNLIGSITDMFLNSLTVILSIFIAPIIAYYILRDMDIIQETFLKVIPSGKKGLYLKFCREANNILTGYVRGQIWVSIIVAILISTGLFFLKIKFILLLGLIAGLTNLIPYIGPIIGSIPALFIALLSSPLKFLGTLVLYVLVQQMESTLIVPRIMSNRVGLHPLVVIFVLLVGAEFFGIWGLLFAIPLAGLLKVVIKVISDVLSPLNEELN